MIGTLLPKKRVGQLPNEESDNRNYHSQSIPHQVLFDPVRDSTAARDHEGFGAIPKVGFDLAEFSIPVLKELLAVPTFANPCRQHTTRQCHCAFFPKGCD